MAEAVQAIEGESVGAAKFPEPVIWSVVVHRFAVPLGEKPVRFNPQVSVFNRIKQPDFGVVL